MRSRTRQILREKADCKQSKPCKSSTDAFVALKQTKTAVPNWFRHPSSAVLNSSVRFGTSVDEWSGVWTGPKPSKQRQPYSGLLYAQETTTAQLRSQFCFPDRLVILNEDRMFSNDYVKGFCRNSRKFSDCRAFSFVRPVPAAGHIATAIILWHTADVLWVQYRAVCHKVDLVPRYYIWVSYMQNRLVILTIYTLPMK